MYERGQFNGAILVAEQGDVIYRNAFGKANFQTATNFTPETPSDIGSVTKQFTAMAIMILAEQNKLSYDDPVEIHPRVRSLPACQQNYLEAFVDPHL